MPQLIFHRRFALSYLDSSSLRFDVKVFCGEIFCLSVAYDLENSAELSMDTANKSFSHFGYNSI
ncbi:hypothetical protein Mar181_0497 [Marinomonas posidonica IVIA-Po-181]|uniref:Uncharacterized protein n=1 Tax=Marinomonas posidonica (strain CECT 7376 / NCIMB 14433 / IVIA-Po-181) TaxID=491952 RepID=F6CZP8_MARPP|nr:hypothetical protein Mar181_0497 [Marinomonas posidonica IVIA-Po-181]